MKEYPEPNYFLKVSDLSTEYDAGVSRFLSGGWILAINHVVAVTFVSNLPVASWPPHPVVNLDIANDHDEAARIVLATSAQLVIPADSVERMDEITGEEGRRQTVFWIAVDRYAALDTELRQLCLRSFDVGNGPRLSDLEASSLRRFLVDDLPRSGSLTEYEREILCLPPPA